MGLADRDEQNQWAAGARRTTDSHDEALRRSAELIADLLDTVIRVPGTNLRFGLDPLIGLLPGLGDAVAALLGSAILLLANRLRVPRIVQARMAVNMLLNGTVGALPGLGDLFSFWFKSNARNARLLRRYASSTEQVSTVGDWAFVIGLIVGVLAIIGLALLAAVWLVTRLWQLVG